MKRYIFKFFNGYRYLGMMLVNIVFAIVIINSIFFMMFTAKDFVLSNPISDKYGDSPVGAIYPDYSEAEVNAMLNETWSRPYIYQPFTQFQEKPYRGQYVNVDSAGFRLSQSQGPWPPEAKNLNIFLFGGSTTFGYGVQDSETIASYLQAALVSADKDFIDIYVYNFGRGFYYSTQERILYEKLILSEFIPDVAIFIDGLNEFYYHTNEPIFTSHLREFIDKSADFDVQNSWLADISIVRAANSLGSRFTSWLNHKQRDEGDASFRNYNNLDIITYVVDRYLSNKKIIEAISSSFKVTSIFIWQPAPTYQYDQEYHLFSKGGYGLHGYSEYGYEYMAKLVEREGLGDNFLWSADIQASLKEPLYVDKVHYSASFSKRIASTIADFLIKKNFVNVKPEGT